MTSVLDLGCDAAVSVSAAPSAARPGRVLAATILSSSLAFVDGTIVNVGLPAIGAGLGGDAADLQWVVNVYLLPLSALLLLGGTAGDRFGTRRLLVAGIAAFGLASVTSALAPSLPALLASRAVQGISAALMLPNSLALLGGAFEGPARGRAIGIWAATGALLGAVGPVLGGWLIDLAGWRAIFVLNLPLAAAAAWLALGLRGDEAPAAGTPPLDWLGGALATAALGGLVFGLTIGSGPAGWTVPAIGAGLGGALLVPVFLAVEHRRGERALMPLRLFGSPRFVGLTVLTFLLYAATGGLMVLLPYLLIQASGYSATTAGAALLPFPLVIAAISPLIGNWAGGIGTRLPLAAGSLLVAAGFALALRIGAGGSYWIEVLPAVGIIALGMAVAVAPLTTAVLAAVDPRYTGSASGLNSAVARTGALVATALLGSVLAAQGAGLVAGFHAAAIAGAVAALAAAASAVLLLDGERPPP